MDMNGDEVEEEATLLQSGVLNQTYPHGRSNQTDFHVIDQSF